MNWGAWHKRNAAIKGILLDSDFHALVVCDKQIATLQFQQRASLDKGKPFYYRLGAIHCQISRLMSP